MMKPSLQLRIGQQLTMTPQLQQAIRLLQLPALDLQAHVGEVATEVIRAVQDRRIDLQEAETLTVVSRKGQRLFERLIRTTLRLSKLRCK